MSAEQLVPLAKRLRDLRENRWPGVSLTQPKLGQALGVGAPSISSWESRRSPTPPPESRLDAYATFFATRRSVLGGQPRLLNVADLTDEELAVRDELAAELRRLRREAVGGIERHADEPDGLWHFPDGMTVRLICGKIKKAPLTGDEEETARSKYASADDNNYLQLMAYADLDAMVELFGHIRAQNPDSDVRFDLVTRLESDDLQSHLVILGGMGAETDFKESPLGAKLLQIIGAPIEQIPDPEGVVPHGTGEIFAVRGVYHRPDFAGSALLADVGLFVRAPNPHYPTTTLTIVSGVFTRGTYGAVRLLTDKAVRDSNEEYLARRFADDTAYAVLMQVPVHRHATTSPDLNVPGVLLDEWSRK